MEPDLYGFSFLSLGVDPWLVQDCVAQAARKILKDEDIFTYDAMPGLGISEITDAVKRHKIDMSDFVKDVLNEVVIVSYIDLKDEILHHVCHETRFADRVSFQTKLGRDVVIEYKGSLREFIKIYKNKNVKWTP